MNSVKLTSEASSADQEAAEEFKQYLLSDIQEKGMWKSRFLVLLKLAYFTRTFAKRTYIRQMASKAPGFKPFQNYATLLLCTNAKCDFFSFYFLNYESMITLGKYRTNLHIFPLLIYITIVLK